VTPPPLSPEAAWEATRGEALALGFNAVGVAAADALESEANDLKQWLAEGRHGSMEWMTRSAEKRADPRRVLPNCRSVVVVAMDYNIEEPADDATGAVGRVSRYARGRDYHRVLEKRLRKLARFIDTLGTVATPSRPFCDHGPVMERQWAERAGIGFRGKNTLLIRPQSGSWFFLGGVLTQIEMRDANPADPIREGCGNCRACLDACPTGALDGEWRIDARRCISYLTIEHDGPIDKELWPRMEGWVFGCDICQDVCPYNRKRAKPIGDDPLAPREIPARWSLVEMLRLKQSDLDAWEGSSPLKRAGRNRLVRNAAIAAGQMGGEDERRELQRIAEDEAEIGWLRELVKKMLGL
jgi:epoxyqueuosine reductase